MSISGFHSQTSMEKRGDLTEDSYSDFTPGVKVKYADASSRQVAGEEDKHKLKDPVPLFNQLTAPWPIELP